jgi:hypothetical protein
VIAPLQNARRTIRSSGALAARNKSRAAQTNTQLGAVAFYLLDRWGVRLDKDPQGSQGGNPASDH